MVETAYNYSVEDVEDFKKHLTNILVRENIPHNTYSDAWLTVDSFGGLSGTEGFIVHIKTAQEIESTNEEIKRLGKIIYSELNPKEKDLILHLRVHNANERIRYNPYEGDIKISLNN